jgi:DNA-binding FadR family transcriptional regulator
MEIGKLTKDNLTEKFVRSFTQLIIRNELPQGTQLSSEAEIARQFDVSRTVVREGIGKLTALGLITKRQGRLSTVADKSEWDLLNPSLLADVLANDNNERRDLLDDLFTIRRLLEGFAAFQAAQKRTAGDIDKLNVLLDILENSISDPQTFMKTDLTLHATIHIASHNMVLSAIMRSIQELLQNSRSHTVIDSESQIIALAQHRTIVEAVILGDSHKAEEAMVYHLNWSRNVLD